MKTLLLILASFLVAATTIAAVSTGTDEQAQLPYWQWEDDVVSIRLVQRLPDQTRAYFAGRGFEDDDVKLIAEHCFFQTVFKNIAPPQSKQTIDYDLRKWYALVDGKRVELKLRGDWRSIWLGRQASAAQ